MNAIPLAQYLVDFDDEDFESETDSFEPVAPAGRPTGGQAFEPLMLVPKTPPVPAGEDGKADAHEAGAAVREDPAAALETARATAFEEGRASMRGEMEAAVAAAVAAERERAERERHEAVEAARAEWVSGEAERLSAAFTREIADLEASVRRSLAAVVGPLAAGARRRRTIDELVAAVGTLMLDGKAFTIRASGPEELLLAFIERLGSRASLVTFAEDESLTDIRLEAERTVIETRLAGWGEAMERALDPRDRAALS